MTAKKQRARQRKLNRRSLTSIIAFTTIIVLVMVSVDAALYASTLPITYTPSAGSTGNVVIDKYSFIVHGVALGNETGIIPNSTVGSLGVAVSVESNVYADFHNVSVLLYNDTVLTHTSLWNNVYINTSVTVLTDYFTPVYNQGGEVRFVIAAEES